jgi:hypothetical protein
MHTLNAVSVSLDVRTTNLLKELRNIWYWVKPCYVGSF